MEVAKVEQEKGAKSFVDGLRELQGQYMMLADIYSKQSNVRDNISNLIRALHLEVDEPIQIRPDILGEKCTSAYMVSEAVVVMFDVDRHMTSRPLHSFPAEVIVSVIQDSSAELGRLLARKRESEGDRLDSLEKILKELKKAQATFLQTKKAESESEVGRGDSSQGDNGEAPRGEAPQSPKGEGKVPAIVQAAGGEDQRLMMSQLVSREKALESGVTAVSGVVKFDSLDSVRRYLTEMLESYKKEYEKSSTVVGNMYRTEGKKGKMPTSSQAWSRVGSIYVNSADVEAGKAEVALQLMTEMKPRIARTEEVLGQFESLHELPLHEGGKILLYMRNGVPERMMLENPSQAQGSGQSGQQATTA